MAIKPIIKKLDYFPNPLMVYSSLRNEPYSALLDSGMDAIKLGRFSFIGYKPFMVAQCKGGNIKIFTEDATEEIEDNPFRYLKEILSFYKTECTSADIPFISGCIGYFSYDLRYFIERLPHIAVDDVEMPDFILCFYDVIIIFDNLRKKAYVSSSGLPLLEQSRNRERARTRLEETLKEITRVRPTNTGMGLNHQSLASEFTASIFNHEISPNFTKEAYFKAIQKAKDLIARGDIYQVNLSQRFECFYEEDPFDLYLALRHINPAPFACYLNFGRFKIVSASPERFVKIKDRYIETRPIKGTRPRGVDPASDSQLKRELLSSSKDRAEHVMIVDLERNDLGRICEYGSVRPTEFIIVETYATVHHLVSTVSGRLRQDRGIIDCLENCFPGGSITGAPKIRAMEVIEELEPTKRGIYTGSIGYIDFCGNADFSIVIRTIVIKDNKAYFQVGGGIVADSDAEKEYQETLDKARALMEAIRIEKTKQLQFSIGSRE